MQRNRLNLIPLPRRQAAERRVRLRRWTWGVCAYAVLLLIGCAACAVTLGADSDDTVAALEKVTRQVEDLSRATASLRPQLAESQIRLSVARTVGDQPDWSQLLALVGTCLDDDVVLSATKMEPALNTMPVPTATSRPTAANNQKNALKPDPLSPPELLTISLQGLAKSQGAVTQFVLRLERLGLFERVTLISSGRQAVGSGEISTFRVECSLRRNVPGNLASTSGETGRTR